VRTSIPFKKRPLPSSFDAIPNCVNPDKTEGPKVNTVRGLSLNELGSLRMNIITARKNKLRFDVAHNENATLQTDNRPPTAQIAIVCPQSNTSNCRAKCKHDGDTTKHGLGGITKRDFISANEEATNKMPQPQPSKVYEPNTSRPTTLEEPTIKIDQAGTSHPYIHDDYDWDEETVRQLDELVETAISSQKTPPETLIPMRPQVYCHVFVSTPVERAIYQHIVSNIPGPHPIWRYITSLHLIFGHLSLISSRKVMC
jgi:hypothetical protein